MEDNFNLLADTVLDSEKILTYEGLKYYDEKIKNYVVAKKQIGSGLTVDQSGTVSVVIDSSLSDTSTNPVQNKVVKAAIEDSCRVKILTINAALTEAELLAKLVENENYKCSGFWYNADEDVYCEFEGLYSSHTVGAEVIHFGYCHIRGIHNSEYSIDYYIDDEDGELWYSKKPNDYIITDGLFSSTSTNPIENQAVTNKFNSLDDKYLQSDKLGFGLFVDDDGNLRTNKFFEYLDGYQTDLFAVDKACFCAYNKDTLNTPYTAGLTGDTNAGICLVNTTGGLNHKTLTVFPAGLNETYTIEVNNRQAVGSWAISVGSSLVGKTVKPTLDTEVVAGNGAEIFNDYRARIFDTSGVVTAGNVATGEYSHVEGSKNTATASSAHAEGNNTSATGSAAHAEGYQTSASSSYSHAEGGTTSAEAAYAHAEGGFTNAKAVYSHAENYQTIANRYQHAGGRYNVDTTAPTGNSDTSGSLFIIGNGTSTNARSNAFRVATNGSVYGVGEYNTSGADYAEMWEWADGNKKSEDRRGYFVTVDANNKIVKANSGDYILGVTSATPCIVGDTASEEWSGRYLRDVFGSILTETVDVEEYIDEETGETVPTHTEVRRKVNPDYDPSLKYIPRQERPEWSGVGLMGKLIVCDDGTAVAGNFCDCGKNGIATKGNTYRVLERIDESHIKILMK